MCKGKCLSNLYIYHFYDIFWFDLICVVDAATMEDLDAAEDEGLGSAPESPLKLQRKESTSSSSDMASPVDKYTYHANNTPSSIHMPPMGNMSHLPPGLNQNRYQGQMVGYTLVIML